MPRHRAAALALRIAAALRIEIPRLATRAMRLGSCVTDPRMDKDGTGNLPMLVKLTPRQRVRLGRLRLTLPLGSLVCRLVLRLRSVICSVVERRRNDGPNVRRNLLPPSGKRRCPSRNGHRNVLRRIPLTSGDSIQSTSDVARRTLPNPAGIDPRLFPVAHNLSPGARLSESRTKVGIDLVLIHSRTFVSHGTQYLTLKGQGQALFPANDGGAKGKRRNSPELHYCNRIRRQASDSLDCPESARGAGFV